MSLRLRLFLVASSIVATVLATVMAFGWVRVLDFEFRRLDDRLCSEARRVALEHYPAHELPRLEKDIQKKLGLRSSDQLLLHFETIPATTSYQSPGWQQALAGLTLEWSTGSDASQRPNATRGTELARCAFTDFQHQGDTWRIGQVITAEAIGMVAANLNAPRQEIRHQMQQALLLEFPLALGLTALGAWLLSAFMTRPLARLREAMKTITPHDLDRRLNAQGEDLEFAELMQSYNTMLERLQRSFMQSTRFSADAAHELKTPLTILRGRIEQMGRQTQDPQQRAALAQLLDEVSRLSSITRKLLLLSQADAGRLDLHRKPLDLSELLQEMLADAEMMAEDRRIQSELEAPLPVRADEVLLRQGINNLLVNAIRYSPADSLIRVSARRSDGSIEVVVTNDCIPVDEPTRARFFERFFRGETSRSRKLGGSGLGLSLAREIARAHGGELRLLPSPLTEVKLQLLLPPE